MGAMTSKGTFNRQAEARQSQKKSYQKFRQSIAKLTKEVNKVKFQNKEKLLELEIAIKSAANDLEIAKTYTEPNFAEVFDDFLAKCGELNKIVKEKLEENDRSLDDIQRPESPQNTTVIEEQDEVINTACLDQENAEDIPQLDATKDKKKSKKSKKKDKGENNVDGEVTSVTTEQQIVDEPSKKDKKKKSKETKQIEDTISSNTLDLDEPDKSRVASKKRFWSFPLRLKRKPSTATSMPPDTPDPIIIIQDPENEDRSLQNIEINQLEKAIKTKTEKCNKRRSKVQSQFFDDVPPPTPSSTPVEEPIVHQQQDNLQQIHNIRMSITTLEEMTKIYRLAKRGNYDYIYDNLNLCVNKLKDMEQDPNLGMLTLRHEKKLAMQQAQECLDVLEGRIEVPDRFHQVERCSGSFPPQVVIARTPSKKRENYQKSVEFIDITDNDEVITFSLEDSKDDDAVHSKDFEKLSRGSSDDLSEDDDLKDILISLKDSTEEIAQDNAEPTKPVLITSF